jgi:rubrerythrin
MKRRFASLTPQEALHVAIFVEERNADIYRQFAELFTEFKDSSSLDIAEAFSDMAEEEERHGTQLQMRYFERYGTQACSITEDEIRDFIEVPKLQGGEIFAITRAEVSPMPAQKALEVALQAEVAAQKFYLRLRDVTDDTELRTLYEEFADFETDHVSALQNRITQARHIGRPDEA